ncbi:6-phosphogluconolactonase [Candidatus Woesearchaeota archaeon]|nr:6-phosphogluconolactonase [Candidatus Woesearchaeota archaeon]
MKISNKKNQEDLFLEAADIISTNLKKVLEIKEEAVLGVVGGRSAKRVFEELKKNKEIDWDNIHLFVFDDRLVPMSDKESNSALLKKGLVDELVKQDVLPKQNAHYFSYDESVDDKGTKRYEEELLRFNGVFDVVFLSSGEDGHIGALYPNHHSIRDDSDYFITMSDSPKPPAERMSASRNLLLKSKYAVLLFVGSSKKDAFNKFLDKTLDYHSMPAKYVERIKNSFVLVSLED